MISYQVEKLADCLEEFKVSLMVAHWQECAEHKDVIPLDPDFDGFQRMDEAGFLLIVTAREEGRLIGYWVGFIRAHIHYKSTLCAHTDIYYIDRDFRARAARGLFSFLHKELGKRGVVRVYNRSKLEDVNAAGEFLEAMGYRKFETGYSRLLEDEKCH